MDRCEIGSFNTFVANNGYLDPNSFNVYIPYRTSQFAGVSSYNNTRFTIAASLASAGAMVHEIGHSFFLYHTFSGYNSSICERVTRDPNDPVFNADTHGDDVVDTAAVPNFNAEYCYNNPDDVNCATNGNYMLGYNIDANCTYIGSSENFYQENFVIDPSDVQNYMAYTKSECRNQFTVGQAIRMRETIRDDTGGKFAAAETTIASLYEPYKGSYYLGGPELPASENPLFQPGFDYEFVECTGPYPQPSDYDDTSFSYNPLNILSSYSMDEQNYETITHPNHSAIRIHQVETGLGQTNIRKCYDNFNRKPKGGFTTRFNDGVFNTNVTIQQLDSIQINDPNLINNLQPGLYNIEEQHDNGATKETVIIKEN